MNNTDLYSNIKVYMMSIILVIIIIMSVLLDYYNLIIKVINSPR